MFGIALVAVGGAFLIVVMVIVIVVFKKTCSNMNQRKRAYSVAGGEAHKTIVDRVQRAAH